MKIRHFYWAILLRMLCIASLSGLATWLFLSRQNYILGGLVLITLLLFMVNIIRYFNNINQWIAFFLMGIENEDASLKIPKKTGSKVIDEVFNGLDRLNEIFKNTKVEISTQEQYFKSIINQSATGLFSVNSSGRIVNINPAAEKLTKLNPYHHVNSLQNIDKALPEFIMQPSTERKMQTAIFENHYGQKLLFKLSELKTKTGEIKLIAVSDITKELDSREVDAWVKLARTLSHEIMNNIAPITTLSQVVSGYFVKNKIPVKANELTQTVIENTVKGLEVIEERSVGLMSFVENYRKFTKLPEPILDHVNLSHIVHHNILAASAFEGFNNLIIEQHIPANLQATTDEKLLNQVLTNILKNAIEAAEDTPTQKAKLCISICSNDEHFRIEIMNTGPEIPPEIREQIFVPFYTTKENGSGIGLSLSKQIMLKMGGDVLLKSSNQQGTIIIILIPFGN